MFEDINDRLNESQQLKQLATSIKEGKRREILCSSLNGSYVVFLLYMLLKDNIKKIIYVSEDSDLLIHFRDDFNLINDPGSETAILTSDTSMEADEINKCLTLMYEGNEFLIFAEKEKLSARLIPPDKFSGSIITLKSGEEFLFEELIDKLNSYGYIKTDFVEMPGDYSVRGGIIDIFPDDYETPVRLEFFGETIESIREFDISTQRSLRLIQSVRLSLRINDENVTGNTSQINDFVPEDCVVFIEEEIYDEAAKYFNSSHLPD